MANPEEVSPLLTKKEAEQGKSIPLLTKKEAEQGKGATDGWLKKTEKNDLNGGPVGWTADGLPLGHGSVLGEPVARSRWDSSLFACLGRNDDFCSSDLEVCLLGSFAPCILYGSNAERLGASPGTFANHCLPYTGLYLLGNSLFGSNYLAPWFSYPSRTAIRHKFNLETVQGIHPVQRDGSGISCRDTRNGKFVVANSSASSLHRIDNLYGSTSNVRGNEQRLNHTMYLLVGVIEDSPLLKALPVACEKSVNWYLKADPAVVCHQKCEGSCEALTRSCGCCSGIIEDEVQRENCESACDFTTHFFCHACALCQEGRELRRRLPHPGFNGRSVVVMIPPAEQAMGR